jgi:hypothetical protein
VHDQRPAQREYVQGRDGYLYEKIYEQPPQGSIHQRRHDAPQAQSPSPQHAPYYEAQDSRAQAINTRVLPSIEGNPVSFSESGRSRAPRNNHRMDQAAEYPERQPQSMLQTRNVPVIDLDDGADARFLQRGRIEEPSGTRRLVSDLDDQRRLSARTALPEHHARSTLEPLRQRPEIIDLSSPRYVREPLHSPRMVIERRTDDEYHPEDPAIRSNFARRPPPYRNVLMPALRPTAYDVDRATYSREYISVTTSQPQLPLSAAQRDLQQAQQQPVIYVDSSPRGPHHDRYDQSTSVAFQMLDDHSPSSFRS